MVENFTVNSYKVNGSRITLDLDWSPPSSPNGVLAPYNICIGHEPLLLDEVDPGNSEGHTCTTFNAVSILSNDVIIRVLNIIIQCRGLTK